MRLSVDDISAGWEMVGRQPVAPPPEYRMY